MTLIKWTPKLLIHPYFDENHKKLVDIVNYIDEIGNKNPSPQQSAEAVETLLKEINIHTKEEESLMHKTAYSMLIPRKIEHDHFSSDLKEFITSLRDGQKTLCEDSTLFIRTWVYDHIASVDKIFAQWLFKKGLLES